MLAAKCHLGTKPYGVHIRVIGVRGAEQIASVSAEVGTEISGKSEPTVHVVSQSRAESLALIASVERAEVHQLVIDATGCPTDSQSRFGDGRASQFRQRTADRLQPWLAAQLRRLGRADAVFRRARLSLYRA